MKVLEIGRGLIRDNFKAQQREFILDSLLSRKPVKRVKQKSYISRSGGSERRKKSSAGVFIETRYCIPSVNLISHT